MSCRERDDGFGGVILILIVCAMVVALCCGCKFFEALVADPDGPEGPKKSPASQAGDDLAKATIDWAGLAALVITVGKTVFRTVVNMRARSALDNLVQESKVAESVAVTEALKP